MDDDTVRLLVEQNSKLIDILARNTAVDAIRAMNPAPVQSTGPDDVNPYRDDGTPPGLQAVGGTPGRSPGAEIAAPGDADAWANPEVPLELLRDPGPGGWSDTEPTTGVAVSPELNPRIAAPIYTEKPRLSGGHDA